MIHVRVHCRRGGGNGPFVDYAAHRAGSRVTPARHAGKGDNAAAERRLQTCRSRCHSGTVKAAAEMHADIASTSQSASHRAIKEIAQRLAVFFRSAQQHGTAAGMPVFPSYEIRRGHGNGMSSLDPFDSAKITMRAELRNHRKELRNLILVGCIGYFRQSVQAPW